MKTIRPTLLSVILMLLFASCGAPTPAMQPSASAVPSPIAPSPTPYPVASVTDYTQLFAGPGNFDYDQLGWLPPSIKVNLLGTFGDFVKVATIVDSKSLIGYIHTTSLDVLPKDLPRLQVGDVPPIAIDATTNFFGNPKVVLSASAITISNEDGNFYNPPQRIALIPGFTLSFKLDTGKDQYGDVRLADKPDNGASLPWWQGIRRMQLHVDTNSSV